MRMLVKIMVRIIVFAVLTIATQIGGMVYLLSMLGNRYVSKDRRGRWSLLILFAGLYLLTTFIFIPPVAKSFGRVPLPLSKKGMIIPNHRWTCFLNRHYVKPKLYDLIMKSVIQYNANEKQLRQVRYLDANFPFMDGFPLLPHRSHDDGEKIDLAFLYTERVNGAPWKKRVSLSGYGFCEGPKPREENMPTLCKQRGYWQYSLLEHIFGKASTNKVQFDAEATRRLIKNLSDHPNTKKIFIEPHLKQRLGFSHNEKVRFHGCKAVRHDDHIHVEM